MGNLKQENRFNTDDGPGGLGIAQWTNARREELMQRADYQRLTTQLQFLVDELNSTEKNAGTALKSAHSVEDATIAFQNTFERCGICRESQRIQYANEILAAYRSIE